MMQHFSPRRTRKENAFQQMNCSVASLEFLDLEGLDELSQGGGEEKAAKKPGSERGVSVKQKIKNNLGLISPRRKSMSKAALSSTTVKKTSNLKETEFDERMKAKGTHSKGEQKNSSTRRFATSPRKKSSERETPALVQTPRTPKTPLAKLRSITPFRRTGNSEGHVEPKRDDSENMQLMTLDDYMKNDDIDVGTPRATKSVSGGRTGTLGAIKQSMTSTFSPRRKSSSKSLNGNSLHSTEGKKLDPHSNKKGKAKRSTTPFRRSGNEGTLPHSTQTMSSAAAAPPPASLVKLLHEDPAALEYVQALQSGVQATASRGSQSTTSHSSNQDSKGSTKDFSSPKRVQSHEKLVDVDSQMKENRRSKSRMKDRSTTPARKSSRRETEVGGRRDSISRRSRSRTPYRNERSQDSEKVEETRRMNHSSHSRVDPPTTISVEKSPRKQDYRKRSQSARQIRGKDACLESNSRHSVEERGVRRRAASNRDSVPKQDTARSRRRTNTPMRRRPVAKKQPAPEEDVLSTCSSSSSPSSSMSSFGGGGKADDLNMSFVQLAVSGIEEKIVQVERTPGSRPADVACYASPLAHRKPRAFNDVNWTKEANITTFSRSLSTGRGLRSPEKSLTGLDVYRSSQTRGVSGACAVAGATVLEDAPPTPCSRNRIYGRRSGALDVSSLHSRQTTYPRGTPLRTPATIQQTVSGMSQMPSIALERND